ncbi:Uncharacterised protein [Bordetella pertussis]|nr:Uncharacterised protein [Bordetella pertussis]
MRVLEAHDVPAAPERLLDELADDAQVRHLEVFQQLRHPRHGPVTAANRAIRRCRRWPRPRPAMTCRSGMA